MPRLLPVALTTVAIAGLTLLTASPALAFATPPTLTFAQPANTEYSNAVVNGECPALTEEIALTAVVTGDPTVYDISAGLAYDTATGLVTGSVETNAVPPGTQMVVTLTCYGAGHAEIAHVDVPYTTNDQGATSTATAADLNSPITVTGDCGTGTGVSDIAFRFEISDTDPGVYPHFSYAGSPWTHDLGVTPADIGAKVGDTVLVYAFCIIDGEPQVLVASSDSTFEVVSPAAALPATGVDATGPMLAGGLLLAAGAALIVARRRARA